MLQAMNTGHDGSLTTIHANSPRDALMRLEIMIAMATSIFLGIYAAIHQLRHQCRDSPSRAADGTRKVVSIQEITGMEGNIITTAGDLFL